MSHFPICTILRALDYFQAVNAPRDPRLAEPIDIVRSSQQKDGRWSLEHSYKGKTYFELEGVGAPSRSEYSARAAGAEVVGSGERDARRVKSIGAGSLANRA